MPGRIRNPGPPTTTKGNGSFSKGESRNPVGRAPRTDHGGEVYRDSDWALRPNGGTLANNMPILREFTRYGEWGGASKRWAKVLYIRPLSRGVDYFASNLKQSKKSLTSKSAGGVLKQKRSRKFEQSEMRH